MSSQVEQRRLRREAKLPLDKLVTSLIKLLVPHLNGEEHCANIAQAYDAQKSVQRGKADAEAKFEQAKADAQKKYEEGKKEASNLASKTAAETNKAIDQFDKSVSEGAAKAKSGISSWFGGK